ncbi:MAG: restriction endonuclease [Deltaproteobacteria bacterium]|nr:restriction endonuclease [Deltaproteobacteria bacterium]
MKTILGYAEATHGIILVSQHAGEIEEPNRLIICPYCKSRDTLYSNFYKPPVNSICHFLDPGDDVIYLCKCGWWSVTKEPLERRAGFREVDAWESQARSFNINSIEAPISELRSYLKSNPRSISEINPIVFEKLMRDCLKDVYAPCEVIHIGQTGDRGIDLKIILSESETYLVQVKRRTNINKNEGVEVVRTLNGVLFRDGEAKGMVVSTAKGFTKAAKDEAIIQTKTDIPYDMKLVSFPEIVKMLKLEPIEPYKPWMKVRSYLSDCFGLYSYKGEKYMDSVNL